MVTVVRDANGLPFSKWKPAVKFAFVFKERWPDTWAKATQEVLFDPSRKWRLDYAWPALYVAVEIDGFGFGHQAQQRIAQNNEKRNAANMYGWRILVYDSRLLGSKRGVEDAVDQVVELIRQHK